MDPESEETEKFVTNTGEPQLFDQGGMEVVIGVLTVLIGCEVH